MELRNNLKLNEILEVFSEDKPLESFVLTSMIDESGLAIEVANKPLSKIRINVPVDVKTGDFIRRKVNP